MSFKIYLDWLKYLSWFRYTNEIFIINQWKGVDDIKVNCTELDNGTEACQYVTGEFVIEDQMGFNIVNINYNKSSHLHIIFSHPGQSTV